MTAESPTEHKKTSFNSEHSEIESQKKMNKAQVEKEFAILELSPEEKADNLAMTMVSVVRDIAISSLYGYIWVEEYKPSFSDIFTDRFSDYLTRKFSEHQSIHGSNFNLYGTTGDLIGQLSRLLIYCKESEDLHEYVKAANHKIEQLGVELSYFKDQEYIKGLRNAILHGNFTAIVDESNWENAKIVFLDRYVDGPKMTGKIVASNEQLMQIIAILVHDIYESRLRDIGWQIC